MNKEDYSKYYIQGSDHYLIPKDVFIELFSEMENWKEESKELNKKYENAVADYETTMAEKEQLNSLVNSCQEEIRQLKKQVETYEIEGYKQNEELNKMSFDIRKYKIQQKEFIKYMNGIIEDLETEDVDDEEMKGYLIQKIDTFKEVLSKYKEIIGDDK